MQSKEPTVAAYLKSLPAAERKVLAALRKEIRAAAPGVGESMGYGMPVFGYGDESVCAFNMQKRYLCLYVEPKVLDKYRAKIKPKPGKCCVRFTLANPLPPGLAGELVRALVALKKKSGG
jgi:uncharacterized protein YdhG (YjbR/CyaY superfamily)